MAQIKLASQIPGVVFPTSVTLDGTPKTVQVSFNGNLLRQDAGAPALPVTATYDDATGRVLVTRTFSPPPVFAGGQLELAELSLTILTKASGTARVLETNKALRPVEATGKVLWKVPPAISSTKVELALSYTYDPPATSGFALRLSRPLAIAGVAQLTEASLAVEIAAARGELVLSLAGALTVDDAVEQKIQDGLKQVFGGTAPDLDPPPFRYRQAFRLTDLLPTGPPTLSLLPRWTGPAPALPALPDLDVRLGLPQFDFTFPDGGGEPLFGFLLRDCAISFPDLAGIKAFTLTGHLRFDRLARGLKLNFEPSAPGAIVLPDVLRFLLDRIEWAASAVSLPDLPEWALASLRDFDIFAAFQRLGLGPIDPAAFALEFDKLVAASLKLPGAPDLAGIFRLALLGLQDAAEDLYGEIVAALGRHKLTSAVKLRELLWSLNLDARFPDARLDLLLDRLFKSPGINPTALMAEWLKWASTLPLGDLGKFLPLWIRSLAGALDSLGPDTLAALINDILKNAPTLAKRPLQLSELPPFSGLPGFDLPQYRFNFGAALAGLGLQGLVTSSSLPTVSLGNLSLGASIRDLRLVIERDLAVFLTAYKLPRIDASQVAGLLLALFSNAEGDPERERILLQWSRFPVLGLVLPLLGAIKFAFTRPLPWLNLLGHPIERDGNVRRLPAPAPAVLRPDKTVETPARKYLIMSDIHRDAAADDRPLFESGAISHFTDNTTLYAGILAWADGAGYTVIEAGDCEELWFVNDLSTYAGPKAQLSSTLTTHKKVYDALVKLHKAGRYFRVYGNHDAPLREAAVRKPLTDRFGAGFEIYDHLIIDGVKTMTDHALTSVLDDVSQASKPGVDRFTAIAEGLANGRLGLDSTPYTSKGPLIVTHGHQFDFWNCDEHGLVGKMIANAVGVPIDLLDDPFQDLEGIALAGSPFVDFEGLLARLPVFNNFPAYDPSRELAHRIQHMANADRLLIADLFYCEYIPALMALVGLPLDQRDDQGNVVPYPGSAKWAPGKDNYLNFINNAICVGHTHYPQSQPYYDLAGILAGPLVGPAVNAARDAVAGLLFGFKPSLNLFRAQYYNSGTAGWMQGVVWAIEIGEDGQARLVFWTKDTLVGAPQEMDWELQPWPAAKREALAAKRAQVESRAREWIERFGAVLAAAGAGLMALPAAALVALHDLLATGMNVRLEEVDPAATDALERVRELTRQAGELVVNLFLAIFAKQVAPATAARTFSLSAPLDPAVGARITEFERLALGLPGVPANAVAYAAALWFAITEQLPFVNGGPARGGVAASFPALWAVLSVLPLLPPDGFTVGGVKIGVGVTVSGGRLTVSVRVS